MAQETCHRCGGDLPTGNDLSRFCPQCGAPQLQLTDSYRASVAEGRAAHGDEHTTGTLPPPIPRTIEWQVALRCIGFIAAVGGLLTIAALRVPGVSLISILWLLTASTTALALYQRRCPLARMDAAVGAQIGLTTGLALVAMLAVSLALGGVIMRFGLHGMGSFDAGFTQTLAQAKEAAVQATAQTSASSPARADVLHLYDIPEFQAGIVLASSSVVAGVFVLFSAFGGALNGLLRTRRRARL